VITGYVIAESLRPSTEFALPGLRLRKIARTRAPESATGRQPTTWTFTEYEYEADDPTTLADALAAALSPDGGWYTDFTAGDERVVVYADKVFRYRRGDATGRAEAVAYGRTVGVPEHQLDWDE
jgi:hypothetical protein